MNRIHLTNVTRGFNPQRLAEEGGGYSVHNRKGADVMHFDEDLRADIALVRRLSTAFADSYENPLLLTSKYRFDIFNPIYAAEDFDPAWILTGIDMSTVFDTRDTWLRAGWKIKLHDSIPNRTWRQWVQASGGIPQVYTTYDNFDPENPYVVHYNMSCDLRNGDYRDYAIVKLVEYMNYYGLDTIHLGSKVGWNMHGSPELSTPDRRYGGNYYPSPYGEGEYEAAFESLIFELADEGIHPVIVNRPDRPEDPLPWSYLSEDAQDLCLGEYI